MIKYIEPSRPQEENFCQFCGNPLENISKGCNYDTKTGEQIQLVQRRCPITTKMLFFTVYTCPVSLLPEPLDYPV